MVTSFSGGRSRREPPTTGKQLVNIITCGCESSAPFLYILYTKPNSSEADYINNHILNVFKYIFNIQLINIKLQSDFLNE